MSKLFKVKHADGFERFVCAETPGEARAIAHNYSQTEVGSRTNRGDLLKDWEGRSDVLRRRIKEVVEVRGK